MKSSTPLTSTWSYSSPSPGLRHSELFIPTCNLLSAGWERSNQATANAFLTTGHIWNWEGRLAGEQDLMKGEIGWSIGGYGVTRIKDTKSHIPFHYIRRTNTKSYLWNNTKSYLCPIYKWLKPVATSWPTRTVTYDFLPCKSRTIHKTRNTWTLTRHETLNTYDIMPLPYPNMSNVSSSLYIRVEKLICQQCKNVSLYPLTKSTS